jgi:hypothetical protein
MFLYLVIRAPFDLISLVARIVTSILNLMISVVDIIQLSLY